MRPLVVRLWTAYRARVARSGGRRDPTRRPWTQGTTLTAPTSHRACFLDGFLTWALNCRRPW
jgi:hypothetical protein